MRIGHRRQVDLRWPAEKLRRETRNSVEYKTQNDNDSWTALMLAAYDGHDEVVDILIKAGADVNRVYWTDTALIRAADCYKEGIETPPSQYRRCLELVIEAGADVNASAEGVFALIIACGNGFDDGVELLIKSGADVNMLGDKGLNPLKLLLMVM